MRLKENKLVNLTLTNSYKDLALLFIRLFVGFMMLQHGVAKISNFAELSTTFPNPIGLGSSLSLILVICAEVGASVCLVLGLLTRPAALVEMFNMSVAAVVVHSPFTISGSELPLMYLGIFTLLFISGAGRYSIDERLRKMFAKSHY